ncbi:uncharacterized protein ACO6RY_00653 [Pungitius sinensis]
MWSVFFVFLSYLDRNFVKGDFLSRALDAEKESKEMFSMLNGTFCAKMSTVRESFLYQVSDGAEVVRSVISPAGMFGNCSVTANQMQVKSFMHECRLGLKEHRADRQLETRFARTDEAKLMCREFKERSERRGKVVKSDDSELPDKVLKRPKRGFTYPGTLWCGAGNMADHYDQLGEFAKTDSCCRIHDHCPHVIHAFSSNYGHTNFKWHSICHCACDDALKDCLRKVNDTSSRVVGQAFFNVIGVPCFELAYEDQCAQRHWYGVCKRYEKFPIAVLREAVPYDFGGIDAIDALPLPPPEKKDDSEKSKDDVKPESTTQSTMSGPEEHSLRNVVTAAEDFIKVLATVSTSQSSTTDSTKSESQSSEKKKRKNTGRKKKTNKKPKGKGRKRKQKTEEGAAVSPSGSKAEEVIALSNAMVEQHQHQQSSRNTNRIDDREYKMKEKEEPFNEVMKDKPSIDKEIVSITSPTIVQRKPAESSDETILSSPITASTHKRHSKKHTKGRKKKSKNISLSPSTEVETNTTDNVGVVFPPTVTTKTQTARPEQQSPVVSTASTPIRIPNVKRNRSKERGDRAGRKKRRKLNSGSSIVAPTQENSSTDSLKVILLTGAPTVPLVSSADRKVSHRMDVYTSKTTVRGTPATISVRKSQKLKGPRSRRRKTVAPLLSENPLFPHGSENEIPIVTTQEKSEALKRPRSPSAGRTDGQSERMLLTAVTATPPVVTERQTIQQQRRPHMKATVALLTDGASIPKQTEQTPVTITPTRPKVATTEELDLQIKEKTHGTSSATPIMSPMQLSIDRAKAQFTRKKRRKAALSLRQ